MEIDVPITGTNYSQTLYDRWCQAGANADHLALQRDKGNPHDEHAVKVMHCGSQMGWVGKSHSRAVAKYIDDGYRVVRKDLIHNSPGKDAMNRLKVRLRLEKEAQPASPAKLFIVKVFGAPSQDLGAVETLKQLRVGKVLDCVSNENRVSIDLIYQTRALAWFRKEEQGEEMRAEHITWANRSNLVARIESQRPLTVSLHLKGSIKELRSADGRLTRDDEGNAVVSYPDSPDPYRDGFYNTALADTFTPPKETTMNNFFSRLLDINSKAAGDAAYLETGRIANNTVAKILIARLPFLARFYAKTPMGKLAIANAGIMLAQQLRPNDQRLQRLSVAMTTVAYQELIQLVDVEGMIDQLLAEPAIKRALDKSEKPGDVTDFKA